jgi:zinc protease
MAVYTLRTLANKEALNQSTQVFEKIINHPDFPNEAFEREKKQQLMAIEQAKDSPDEVANLTFFNTLYQDHPYAHSPLGTKETVNALNKSQVMEFYKHYYVAHNALLIIVGALGRPQAQQLADKLTKALPQGEKAQALPKAEFFPQAKTINIPFPSSQTKVRLGQIGIDHHNPNYFPLLVGNYILGGGTLLSRLGLEVREKRGLTYGVTSQFMSMPGSGPFLISLSTKNNSTKEALKITQDTLQTFISEGPTEKELDAAKQYLSGSFPLSLGSNSAIASLLLRMSFYQLPDDFLDTYVNRIKNTTREQIRQAFLHQVHPDSMLLLTVGQS